MTYADFVQPNSLGLALSLARYRAERRPDGCVGESFSRRRLQFGSVEGLKWVTHAQAPHLTGRAFAKTTDISLRPVRRIWRAYQL